MLDTRLTKESRDRALARLSESSRPGRELDVLVIGGGITGAGIALDAASRGLETVVVEAQDWGAGTSSRSSKLVHGGLRYLQMLDFKLVFEALAERDLLLTTVAPHLVRPVPFLYPLRHRVWERAFVGAGIALYDVLATLRRGKRASPGIIASAAPTSTGCSRTSARGRQSGQSSTGTRRWTTRDTSRRSFALRRGTGLRRPRAHRWWSSPRMAPVS